MKKFRDNLNEYYWLHPFSENFGYWNKSYGGGGTLTDIPNPSSFTINYNNWSVGIYKAESTDPTRTIDCGGYGSPTINVPVGADITGGSDGHFAVFDPDGIWIHEFYDYDSVAETAQIYKKHKVNGTGHWPGVVGTRAYGGSCVAGLIHFNEFEGMQAIEHRLAIGLPNESLLSGQVLPAENQDSDGATAYSGTIPMGSHLVIDPALDVTTIISDPTAIKIAQALQRYGGFVVDRAGSAGGFKLYAHPGLNTSTVSTVESELLLLASYFRRVTY